MEVTGSSASVVTSLRPTSPRVIWDPRTDSRNTDEIVLVRQSEVVYNAEENSAVQFLLVLHRSFNCFELVILQESSAWVRFYFMAETLYNYIRPDDLAKLQAEKITYFKKRHRHFDVDDIFQSSRFEIVANHIQNVVIDLYHYDLYQRIPALPIEGADPTRDIFGRPAVYHSYSVAPVALMVTKPDFLVPVNVDPQTKVSCQQQYEQAERRRRHLTDAILSFKEARDTPVFVPPVQKPLVSSIQNVSLVADSSKNPRFTATEIDEDDDDEALYVEGSARVREKGKKSRMSAFFSSIRASFVLANPHSLMESMSGKHRNQDQIYDSNKLVLAESEMEESPKQSLSSKLFGRFVSGGRKKALAKSFSGTWESNSVNVRRSSNMKARRRWAYVIRRVILQIRVKRTRKSLAYLESTKAHLQAESGDLYGDTVLTREDILRPSTGYIAASNAKTKSTNTISAFSQMSRRMFQALTSSTSPSPKSTKSSRVAPASAKTTSRNSSVRSPINSATREVNSSSGSNNYQYRSPPHHHNLNPKMPSPSHSGLLIDGGAPSSGASVASAASSHRSAVIASYSHHCLEDTAAGGGSGDSVYRKKFKSQYPLAHLTQQQPHQQ